jgi:hypothetical protein
MRRTKAARIYKKTANVRAVQLFLGLTKFERTVCCLGIEVDDALSISEQVDCELRRKRSRHLREAGPRSSRGEDFRPFSNGRYRRGNAPFTITAINREVTSKPVDRRPSTRGLLRADSGRSRDDDRSAQVDPTRA